MQAQELITATQVRGLLQLPNMTHHREMSLRDQITFFGGPDPVSVVPRATGSAMYLYDPAQIVASAPVVRQRVKEYHAQMNAKRAESGRRLGTVSTTYAVWCRRIANAANDSEIAAVVAEIRGQLRAA